MKGTVFVEGAQGESIENCIAVSGEQNRQGYCFVSAIRTTLEEGNLDNVFDMVRTLYVTNASFKNQCHDVMHSIGSTAFDAYVEHGSVVIRPETSYCGYGFFHGFVEKMLATHGSGYLTEASTYCQGFANNKSLPTIVGRQNASNACFHGLGHALFDSLPESDWGDEKTMVERSIALCLKTSNSSTSHTLCAAGVFNSLAIARSAQTYYLSSPSHTPTTICNTQKIDYQPSCVKELSNAHIGWNHFDEETALAFIRTLGGMNTLWALEAYVDNTIRSTLSETTPNNIYDRVVSLGTPTHIHAGIKGAITAFFIGGEPGEEYKPAVAFCALFKGAEYAEDCYTQLQRRILIYTEEKRKGICQLLPLAEQHTCELNSRG